MKVLKISIVLLFIGLIANPIVATAKSKSKSGGGPSAYRLSLLGGISDQAFKISEGADFSSIRQAFYAIAFEKKGTKWSYGLRYFTTPAANLKSFWIDAVNEGAYKITFTRYQLLGGYRTAKWNYQLLIGSESSTWAGTPELALKKKNYMHYGAVITYDMYIRGKMKFPFVLSYVLHPARKYEFGNYPTSTVEVAAGGEISLGTGIAFEF